MLSQIMVNDKPIRREKRDGQWDYAYVDLIGAVTDTKLARGYASYIKNSLLKGNEIFNHIVRHRFMVKGKNFTTNCLPEKWALKLIDAIDPIRGDDFKKQVKASPTKKAKNKTAGRNQKRIDGYRKNNKSDEWIGTRFNAMEVRKKWNVTLIKHHAGFAEQYAIITDKMYEPILNCTAKEWKKKHGLKNWRSVRDYLDASDNSLIMLSENAVIKLVEQEKAEGFDQIMAIQEKVNDLICKTKKSMDSLYD